MSSEIRGYRPADHAACRDLWVEMVEAHSRLYEYDSGGTDESGAKFENYLTRINLSGVWVAITDSGQIVGMTGLLIHDHHGEIDPLVVAETHRGAGIGTALVEKVVAEAEQRGLGSLRMHPHLRNVDALKCLYDAGFTGVSQMTVVKDIKRRDHGWKKGIDIYSMPFDI